MMKSKIVLKMIIPYVMCTIFPICFLFFLMSILVNFYGNQIIETKRPVITENSAAIFETIETVEEIGEELQKSQVIENYVLDNLSEDRINYSLFYQMQDEIQTTVKREKILHARIIDYNAGRVFTSDGMYSSIKKYYEYKCKINNLSYEEWIESECVLSNESWGPVKNIFLSGVSYQVMEYTMIAPVLYASMYPVKITILVDVEELFSGLVETMNDNDEVYLYGPDGKLWWSRGNKYELWMDAESVELSTRDGEEIVYGTQKWFDDGRWRIAVYVVNESVLGITDSKTWLLIGCFCLVVLLSLGIAIYYTYRNNKNINNLLKIIMGEVDNPASQEIKEFEMLVKPIMNLVKEKDLLLEEKGKWRNAEKNYFFQRLIQEEYKYVDMKQIPEMEIIKEFLVVVCFRFEDSKYRHEIAGESNVKELLGSCVAEYIKGDVKMVESAAKEISCIIFSDDTIDEAFILEQVNLIEMDILLPCEIDVLIGIGSVEKGICNIRKSYQCAKEVIEYQSLSQKRVFLYSSMMYFRESYFCVDDFEEKFAMYIGAGKNEMARALLEKIFEENLNNTTNIISLGGLKRLRSRIMSAMVVQGENCNLNMDEMINLLNEQQTLYDFFQKAYILVSVFSEKNELKNQDEKVALIMAYIQEHFSDPNLNLEGIAKDLGFNKEYLSKVFKRNYGKNLFATIEEIRINRACEYLKKTNNNIADIANLVGYNSDLSFRRAFKKVMGVNPLEYREASK